MKLCKDCEHFVRGSPYGRMWTCDAVVEPVVGAGAPCSDLRLPGALCGPDAKLFVERKPEPARQSFWQSFCHFLKELGK